MWFDHYWNPLDQLQWSIITGIMWNLSKFGVVNFQRFVIGDKLRGDQSEGWGMGEWVMCSQLLESSKVVLGYAVANAITMAIVFKSKSKILFARPNFQTIAKVNKIQPLIGTKSYWMAKLNHVREIILTFSNVWETLTLWFIVGLYLHCLMSFR